MMNRVFKRICTVVALLLTAGGVHADEWVGQKTDFHSFEQVDFLLGELPCKVVVPRQEAAGRPWVWRARFWGHQPQVDIALLEKGFHIAYVDVADLFGSPTAVERWDAFYAYLTTEKGFSKTPAIEAMSRGGLIAYNWASKNPAKVSCIYADAPVCDIKSWPGGKGNGKGAAKEWKQCLNAYGFSETEALAYAKNPLDALKPLADAGVPLLHVVGDADQVVPVAENTAVLEARYKALGGSIDVIHKSGVGHHPHCLKDPAPIVAFILKHAMPIRVACVGDSITFGATIKDRSNNSYPAQLGGMLGSGYVVRNFGVNGATLLKKGNKPYWKTKQFGPAHAFNPDVVVIKLGTNDSKPVNWQYKADYVSDYVALIESFRSLPSEPDIWICYPVPAYPGNFNITDKVMKEEVIPLIDEVAKRAQVERIDLYSALSHKAELFQDKVHPNAEGARIMAETISSIIGAE
jgi:lysophospholipase L1-like esterase/pimeloyl-ACP methyl ester carboxylesterase